ncbi:MAG: hypothetical protein AAGU14_00155 [Eubacteriaceae bacterium]
MIDKLTYVTVNETNYPMAFTLNVAESIQDKYGSLEQWGTSLDNGKEPRLKDVIWTFQQFINEGIDIENETNQKSREFLSHKQAGRLITSIGIKESSELIKELTSKFNNAGSDEKNSTTTQNQT